MIAVMVIASFAAAMLVTSSGRKGERDGSVSSNKALYIAETGMSESIQRVQSGLMSGVGTSANPQTFGGGTYWTSVTDNGDGTAVISSLGTYDGEERATQVTMVETPGGVFASAIFAGNSSNDASYDMKFGGTGTSADAITGNIYSGGNVVSSGAAKVTGEVKASGKVTGITGATEGVSLPVPDIAGKNYEVNNDYDVAKLFKTATLRSNSSLGGKAWTMPEISPVHIFRKNPDDRTANTALTPKDDYFLEDPYESVNSSTTVTPSNATHISLAGAKGKSGTGGSDKVYYIDGNLWIHNNNIYSFVLYDSGSTAQRVTLVVKGNIYISDNILYQGVSGRQDALAMIAIKDKNYADSGNIYFGDPSFGTLEQMDAFMYAENNFLDNNMNAAGSAKVTVNGNMTAGNQVKINRDFGTKHSKLTVNFDGRLLNNTVTLPGLPDQAGLADTWAVAAWTELAPQVMWHGTTSGGTRSQTQGRN